MKLGTKSTRNKHRIHQIRCHSSMGFLTAATCLILGLSTLHAQTPLRELGSVATPPKAHDELVSSSLIQDQAFGWTEAPRESIGALYNLKKLKRSAFSIQSSLSAGYMYENNVNLRQSTGRISSSIYTITPNIAAAYKGSHGFTLGLRYGLNYQKFENSALKSALNHNAGMNFTWGEGRLRIFGNAGYAKTASANVDAGDRIAAESIMASLGFTYAITDKTRFGVTYSVNMFLPTNTNLFTQNGVQVNQSLIKTRMQQIGTYVDYQFSPKTTLGLGADAGVMDVNRGDDRTFYRLLLRASWAATPRLTVTGSAGPQYNKPQNESGEMSTYWNLGVNYRLVDTGKTTFGLNIYRNQFSSVQLINQSYNSTGISGSITWVPVSRLRLSTALGYEHADYVSNSSTVTSSRQDNLYFIRPAVVYAISHCASVSMFYQYTRNDSSGIGAAQFTRDSFGVAMNVTF